MAVVDEGTQERHRFRHQADVEFPPDDVVGVVEVDPKPRSSPDMNSGADIGRVQPSYYDGRMIRSWCDRDAKRLFDREPVPRLGQIQKSARVRLELLDAASTLFDLGLPGLRLEALKGDHKGQHSIRINDQFRVCFRWDSGDAYDVEIVDYH